MSSERKLPIWATHSSRGNKQRKRANPQIIIPETSIPKKAHVINMVESSDDDESVSMQTNTCALDKAQVSLLRSQSLPSNHPSTSAKVVQPSAGPVPISADIETLDHTDEEDGDGVIDLTEETHSSRESLATTGQPWLLKRRYTDEQLLNLEKAKRLAQQISSQARQGPSAGNNWARRRQAPLTGNDWVQRQLMAAQARALEMRSHLNQQYGTPRELPSYFSSKRAHPFHGATASEDRLGSVTFSLLSTEKFQISVELPVPKLLLEMVKLTPGSNFDRETKKWSFPIASYQQLFSAVGTLRSQGLQVNGIPNQVLAVASLDSKAKLGEEEDGISEEEFAPLKEKLPPNLASALAPFQRKGVYFVHGKEGRALIADEMGLGKTIQGIASSVLYKEEWPCLVISPSSARYHWKQEFLMWLGADDLGPEGITVVLSSKTKMSEVQKLVIISYDLCSRMAEDLLKKNFQVIIADECHYLKNPTAKRTQAIVPLLHQAKRAILLSGTPALSRPIELFTQLSALLPNEWNSLQDYGLRYCDGKKGRYGWDFSGASNIDELHTILSSTIMIRRQKSTILAQLPPKRRELVRVPIDDMQIKMELRKNLEDLSQSNASLGKMAKAVITKQQNESPQAPIKTTVQYNPDTGLPLTKREIAQRRRAVLMAMFQQTGKAKIPAIERHLNTLFSDVLCGKILVFGHHLEILDSIQENILKAQRIGFIRIDGKTSPKLRQTQVQEFQTEPTCRVALLGIMAAGVAITLTAASRVIFTELYWTPAAMLQAEDRCHRIGQTSEVHIQYLVADGTLDDCLWPLIRAKMHLLGDMIEGDKSVEMTIDSTTESPATQTPRKDAAAAKDTSLPVPTQAAEAVEQLASELAIEELRQESQQHHQSSGKPDDSDSDLELLESSIRPEFEENTDVEKNGQPYIYVLDDSDSEESVLPSSSSELEDGVLLKSISKESYNSQLPQAHVPNTNHVQKSFSTEFPKEIQLGGSASIYSNGKHAHVQTCMPTASYHTQLSMTSNSELKLQPKFYPKHLLEEIQASDTVQLSNIKNSKHIPKDCPPDTPAHIHHSLSAFSTLQDDKPGNFPQKSLSEDTDDMKVLNNTMPIQTGQNEQSIISASNSEEDRQTEMNYFSDIPQPFSISNDAQLPQSPFLLEGGSSGIRQSSLTSWEPRNC